MSNPEIIFKKLIFCRIDKVIISCKNSALQGSYSLLSTGFTLNYKQETHLYIVHPRNITTLSKAMIIPALWFKKKKKISLSSFWQKEIYSILLVLEKKRFKCYQYFSAKLLSSSLWKGAWLFICTNKFPLHVWLKYISQFWGRRF